MSDKLLPRTPAQLDRESFGGYLLRVSEENGYRFPRRIAHLAAVEPRSMFTVKADLNALSKVLGRRLETWQPYSKVGIDGTLNAQLCGQPISAGDLRPWTPSICPCCIERLGHIPAWTDLSIVDACPFHESTLLSRCDSCRLPLSWERWGLLRCKCGAKLSAAGTAPTVDAAHRDLLLDVVDAVAFDWTNDRWAPRTQALEGCQSLAGTIATIRSLAKLHAVVTSAGGAPSVMRRAARIAYNWPENLLNALSLIGDRTGAEGGLEHLSRHRHGVYRELRRELPASELAHLRNAMNRFSNHAPVPDPTALLLLDAGTISSSDAQRGDAPVQKNPRKTRTSAPDSAGTVRYSEISHVSGLPYSVMLYLRRVGVLAVRGRARYVAKFHAADIQELGERLRSLPICDLEGEELTLQAAMRRKLFHADGKGELVAAVFNGRIRLRGHVHSGGIDAVLHAPDVDEFCAEARRKTFSGALTPTEVATILQCSHVAAVSLFLEGHVAGVRSGARNVRLHAEAVASFHARYRSIAGMAKQHGTSSNKLRAAAERHNIELLTVAGNKGCAQSFVRREDEAALAATLE